MKSYEIKWDVLLDEEGGLSIFIKGGIIKFQVDLMYSEVPTVIVEEIRRHKFVFRADTACPLCREVYFAAASALEEDDNFTSEALKIWKETENEPVKN